MTHKLLNCYIQAHDNKINCFNDNNCQSTIGFEYVKYFVWGQHAGVEEWSGSTVNVTPSVSNPQNTERNMHRKTTEHAFIPKEGRQHETALAKNAEGGMTLPHAERAGGGGWGGWGGC